MFHQTFQPRDLLLVLVLMLLEGLLSIDNAMVLGLLARRLPERSQTKALTYGLLGSFVFRVIAVVVAAWLLKINIFNLLGGAYLIFMSMRNLLFTRRKKAHAESEAQAQLQFWTVVASIELTDIAFAADSILASIALVGPAPPGLSIHPKLWLILLGGMMGVFLMRAAAVLFIRLLKTFPRLETTAYLLVTTVGLKLIADWWYNREGNRLDFESLASPAFWIFWGAMLLCISIGFLPSRRAVS